MTWSVRGIDDEARERALDSARRSGMSVGEWLNSMILDRESGARGRDSDRRPGSDLDRRLEELDARLQRMSDTAAAPRRPAKRREDPDLEAVSEALTRLISERGEPRDGGSRHGGAATEARRDGRRIDDLVGTLETLDRRLRNLSSDAPRDSGRSSALDRASAEASRPARFTSDSGHLDRAVAEIQSRQAALTRHDPPPPRPERGAGRTDVDLQFRQLSERLDALATPRTDPAVANLAHEMAALRTNIQARLDGVPSARDLAEFRDLGRKVEELVRRRPDPSLVEPLVAEIGRLRETIQQSNLEAPLKNIERGYDRVVERLDDLKRRAGPQDIVDRLGNDLGEIRDFLRVLPGNSEIGAIERRLDDVARRLDDIADSPRGGDMRAVEMQLESLRREIGAMDPAQFVKFFDQRLRAVTEKIENVERLSAGTVSHEAMARLADELRAVAAGSRTADQLRTIERRTGEIVDRLAELEERASRSRLTDELADEIGAIALRLERMEALSADRSGLSEIERRIGDLANRLDRGVIAQADPRQFSEIAAGMKRIESVLSSQGRTDKLDALGALEKRLQGLVDRLDGLDSDRFRALDVAAISREIADLRQEITSNLVARGDDRIGARIDDLAAKIEASGRAAVPGNGLEGIETALTRMTRRLEEQESRLGGLGAIENALTQIQLLLSDRQGASPEAAREAAREALREFKDLAEGRGSTAAIAALRDEIEQIRTDRTDQEGDSSSTLRSVQDALNAVVGRLHKLETRPAEEPPIAREPRAWAPAPQPRTSPEDHRPLEPGSGRPALGPDRTARPQLHPQPEPAARPSGPISAESATGSRKADFIAAARRAAQAAQASTTLPIEEPHRLPGSTPRDMGAFASKPAAGPLARIGAALKGRKGKPLMLAAAAVLFAVLALQFVPRASDDALTLASADRTTISASRSAPSPASPAMPGTQSAQAPAASSRVAGIATPDPQSTGAFAPRNQMAGTSAPPTGGFSSGFSDAGTSAAPSAGFARRDAATAAPAPSRIMSPPRLPAQITAAEPEGPADAIVTASIQPAAEAAAARSASIPDKVGSSALRSAALAGDPKAQFEVGLRYAEGRSVPADLKEASVWYAKAAERGHVPAQYRLGSAYEKGHTGTRDVAAAKRWYQAAAESGNVRAMHNLGVLHANDRDMANALVWFQKAADSGVRDSQFNLGIIHALGSGVKQDLAVAYKWFALAAAQGDKDAEKKRDDVTAHLDKTALAAARMAVQTFRQKPVDRAANDESTVWAEPAGSQPPMASVSDVVARAQGLMQARGAYAGPVDGQLNAQTRQAVKTLQRKLGLKQTGEPDEALVQALQKNRKI